MTVAAIESKVTADSQRNRLGGDFAMSNVLMDPTWVYRWEPQLVGDAHIKNDASYSFTTEPVIDRAIEVARSMLDRQPLSVEECLNRLRMDALRKYYSDIHSLSYSDEAVLIVDMEAAGTLKDAFPDDPKGRFAKRWLSLCAELICDYCGAIGDHDEDCSDLSEGDLEESLESLVTMYEIAARSLLSKA